MPRKGPDPPDRQCGAPWGAVRSLLAALCLLFFDSLAGLQGQPCSSSPGRGHLIALVLAMGHPVLVSSVAF